MSEMFSADEIFQIGIEIEKNGKAFYEEAARRATDAETRKLFEGLARWENEHIATFETLRASLTRAEGTSTLEDVNDEVYGYLKASADTHVFVQNKDPAALAARCRNATEALQMALGFEKDSVVVYTSMRMVVPQRLGRDKVEALVDEELKHVAMLTRMIEERR